MEHERKRFVPRRVRNLEMEVEVDQVVKKLQAQKKAIEDEKAAKVACEEPVEEVILNCSQIDEISALKMQIEMEQSTIKKLEMELKKEKSKVAKLEKQLQAVKPAIKNLGSNENIDGNFQT
jgi:chromosome segregation ATPase